MRGRETVDETATSTGSDDAPVCGALAVFSGDAPSLVALRLERGVLAIGRDDPAGVLLRDERLSRHHAELRFDGARWSIRDLGSRNGTSVDGEAVVGTRAIDDHAVVRAGSSVFLLVADIRPFRTATVDVAAAVVRGPRLAAVLDEAARAYRGGDTLLVLGESGSGKEVVARAFHAAATKPGAPFVAVNCANIPEGVAERLLFGTKRGAYSGAMGDVGGYVQSAEGGVLFLDEIGELDVAVQAKLLRVVETKEVTPLGGAVAHRVDVRFCAATNRDLRAEAEAGRFRSDLYFRLAENEVVVPPLRHRREEIPWLVATQLVAEGLVAHARLVEACLLRPWPGNVRELQREVKHAARKAVQAGSHVVRLEHLREDAGVAMASRKAVAAPRTNAARTRPTRKEIEDALASTGGNISATARALGLHRTQLQRSMKKLGVAPPSEG